MSLAIGKQLTPQERLNKAVVSIIGNQKYAPLAGVLMIGTRGIDDEFPTAYTNGRDEFYSTQLIEMLNDAELRFVVLHENFHKLYQHLSTWLHLFERNPAIAGQACDYVINLKIVDENKHDKFAVMPVIREGKHKGKPFGLIDERFRGMNVQQVFDILYKEQQQQQQEQQSKTIGGEQSGQGQGGQSQPDNSTGEPDPNSAGGSQVMDSHDYQGAKELSAEDKQELKRDIDEAIRQGALLAGKDSNNIAREFGELLEPQIDWREVCREFVVATCRGKDMSTWRRPNRKFLSAGVYLPSAISEQVEHLVIATDMSGSTYAVVNNFLTEMAEIATAVKPKYVHVIYWDTKVCGAEQYELHEVDQMVKRTKPRGGGGTDVVCVPEYLKKHNIDPQAVIILTDGYLGSDHGTWTCPTLWCVIDHKQFTAKHGKTLHIKSSDF